MKKLSRVYSHLELQHRMTDPDHWFEQLSDNETIRKSDAMWVDTYDDLVEAIAFISNFNRDHHLFFRGQGTDYQDDDLGTTILPTLYRPGANGRTPVKERLELMDDLGDKLAERLQKMKNSPSGTRLVRKYRELRWSILQHYEVCPTPLLDLTHSLHVATSFALMENKGDTAHLMVIAMPTITDSISYYTSEELFNIRLLSFCPPEARRPFFQEGYVAGPFPFYKLDDPSRKEQHDFGRRLVAKFKFPSDPNKFYGDGFDCIPKEKLYQPNDPFLEYVGHL